MQVAIDPLLRLVARPVAYTLIIGHAFRRRNAFQPPRQRPDEFVHFTKPTWIWIDFDIGFEAGKYPQWYLSPRRAAGDRAGSPC
jgi:hypothetical protein